MFSRLRFFALLAGTLLALNACAPSCEDFCTNWIGCEKTILGGASMTQAQCVGSCERDLEDICGATTDDFISCVGEAECETAQTGQAELAVCFTKWCPGLLRQ